MEMPSRFRLLGLVTVAMLLLDQATKYLVDSRFALGESVTMLENFFHLTYVRNKGAAFGILANSSIRIPFFILVSLAALAGIFWYLRRLNEQQRLMHWALALIFSGALGNLIDRIRLGEVIDFLDFHWYQHHWPAFNVADSAITIGVGLLLLDIWREERARKQADG